MSCLTIECMKQCDYLIKTECSHKQLIFWLNHQHLHRQNNNSKLVSAMPNFHAKTQSFWLKHHFKAFIKLEHRLITNV